LSCPSTIGPRCVAPEHVPSTVWRKLTRGCSGVLRGAVADWRGRFADRGGPMCPPFSIYTRPTRGQTPRSAPTTLRPGPLLISKPHRDFCRAVLGGCRETLYIYMIVLLSQPSVVPRLPRSLTYLGFCVTDDCEVSQNWRIVPQYRQSIAFRNSLLRCREVEPSQRLVFSP
jgi:hypothetical protein